MPAPKTPERAPSPTALSRHAKAVAKKRGPAARSASARKAARTRSQGLTVGIALRRRRDRDPLQRTKEQARPSTGRKAQACACAVARPVR
jgi:hypothetical protein